MVILPGGVARVVGVLVESEWKPVAGPETPPPNRRSCTPDTFADKKQMRNWESSGS